MLIKSKALRRETGKKKKRAHSIKELCFLSHSYKFEKIMKLKFLKSTCLEMRCTRH